MSNGPILVPDELNALLEGLNNGSIDLPPLPAPGEVTPYDLTSDDQIKRTRLPGLQLISERFARSWRVALYSTFHRTIECTPLPISLIRFADFANSLETPTSLNMISMKPLRGTCLVTLAPELVHIFVDVFYGGNGRFPFRKMNREFTAAETRVIELVLKQTYADLTDAWRPLMPVEPAFIHSESNPHLANVVGPREYMVVCPFEVTLENVTAQFNIAYPFTTLDPHRDLLENNTARITSAGDDEAWLRKLEEMLQDVPVVLSANLSEALIALGDLTQLQVGSLIPIQAKDHLEVTVGGVPIFTAEYGQWERMHSLSIVSSPIDGDPLPQTQILKDILR